MVTEGHREEFLRVAGQLELTNPQQNKKKKEDERKECLIQGLTDILDPAKCKWQEGEEILPEVK